MNTFNKHEPVTMGNWMVTMVVLAIPILNLIMLFYWAFSSATNPSKRTYCQAILMFGLLALGIGAIVVIFGQVAG